MLSKNKLAEARDVQLFRIILTFKLKKYILETFPQRLISRIVRRIGKVNHFTQIIC